MKRFRRCNAEDHAIARIIRRQRNVLIEHGVDLWNNPTIKISFEAVPLTSLLRSSTHARVQLAVGQKFDDAGIATVDRAEEVTSLRLDGPVAEPGYEPSDHAQAW